ncbi:MAG TPA: bifunctional tetrahydrofolate synthase/dihydrofolate synthase [Spongiibacteraceae bacterium]|nr:bifunctional tetrahydrofolate synthase/dihydrofolate synthase [Spongiibacteraceae bacterium]
MQSSRTLAEWLAWMEAHHPRQIELGLERVAAVASRLTIDLSCSKIITVGGTNGKGSCVAFLEAILRAAGYRVGAYTSPHLLHYNERVRIDGIAVDDAQLCDAFETVHAALGAFSLTYFEFGTLAALWLFQRAQLDVVILEVGLGGRLDAVNIIDPDVAVLTSIDLDHQDWLGTDRESIGAEKAGIFRAHKPAICVDEQPPRSVIDTAQKLGAQFFAVGSAFDYADHDATWCWSSTQLPRNARYDDLPKPSLPLPSAAAALAALHCLPLAITSAAIAMGLRSASLAGRFQRIGCGAVEVILDVGHNPHAARWLAQRLAQTRTAGRTLAVFAMMADKDMAAVIDALKNYIEAWYIGALRDNPRAASVETVAQVLQAQAVTNVVTANSVDDAYAKAIAQAQAGDRIVVFGSFFTVAAVLARLQAK